MSEKASVVKCANGHEWPAETKFCGICGKKTLSFIAKSGSFLIGVGQTGGEVILQYLSHFGIKDSIPRSVILDTSADSLAKFNDASLNLGIGEEFSKRLHLLSQKGRGTGRSWKLAESAASEDSKLEPFLIENGVQDTQTAFIISALGGGTGSGVSPYVSDMLSRTAECDRIALIALPSNDEPDLAHFNAYCGLSKLLQLHRRQNIDFMILVSGTGLQAYRPMKSSDEEMSRIETVATIVKLLTKPRDPGSVKWFGLSDLVRLGKSAGVIHGIPSLGLNHSLRIYDGLAGVLESALTQTLSEVRTEAVMFAPVYVFVPLHLKKTFNEEIVVRQYNEWRTQTFPGDTMGEICISYVDTPRKTLDVLLLLCGCDLDETLSRTVEGYRRVKNSLLTRKLEEHEEILSQEGQIIPEELHPIEKTLTEYIAGVRALYKRKPTKKAS